MNWYYAVEGRSQGPFTESSLKRLLREGVINDATLVWHPGLDLWRSLAELMPELAAAAAEQEAEAERKAAEGGGVLKRWFGWGRRPKKPE